MNDQLLQQRTLNLIKRGGRILLKYNLKYRYNWYLGAHTNLAASYDRVQWVKRSEALPFCNLKVAYVIAPLFDCKVVVVYPKRHSSIAYQTIGELRQRKLADKKASGAE